MLHQTYMEHKLFDLYDGFVRKHGPQKGPERFNKQLQACFKEGELDIRDVSIKRLAIRGLGSKWYEIHERITQGLHPLPVMEAGTEEAVDVTAFSNITGQIVYTALLEYYEDPAFIGDLLMPTIRTTLETEKIAGVGKIGDVGEEVHPGMPYPHTGLNEDFIDTPRTTKRGVIIPVTREAIFFDRTAQVMRRAGEVGQALRWRKEKDQLRVVLGITNPFRWLDQTFLTYVETANTGWTAIREGSGTVNARTNVVLLDWTDIEQLHLLFADIDDPNTGEPIVINPDVLLVPPALWWTARRILSATEIRSIEGAQETITGNVLQGLGLTAMSSPLLDDLLVAEGLDDGAVTVSEAQADASWWYGTPRKAFVWMENWPLMVTQAPANSEAEFLRDITLRFKASERGVAAVWDPRYMTRSRSTV